MDPHREQLEAYLLGLLEADERAALERHLRRGCAPCRVELGRIREVLGRLASPVTPDGRLRQHVLDLAQAPRLPLDLDSFAWEEPFPGVRVATIQEDPARSFRASLLWARPGALFPLHRHGGDESVLVLQGSYRDEEGRYGPGEVAHRKSGSVHAIEILPGEDCISYVVAYGETEILARGG